MHETMKRDFKMRKIFTLLLASFTASLSFAQTDCSDLYFSEYIEGGSSNKALEIYNPSSSTIDLSGYAVALFSNGATTPGSVLYLDGMLASGEVYTIVNSSASSTLTAIADTTHSVTNFNGNDAVVLGDATNLIAIDVIGEVGKSTTWTVGTGSTSDNTLVRKSSIKVGETDWSKGDDTWDVYTKDEFKYFGSHTSACISTGNPGTISIKDLRVNDMNGHSTYDGQKVVTGGVVNNSTNFAGSNLQVSIQSGGWGITTFLSGQTYTPRYGDSIWIYGTLGEYNGLTQFTSADSIVVKDSGRSLTPEVVTALDEKTESKLIKFENMWFADYTQWKNSGSFNIDVTNGMDTFAMRVDSDTDIDGRDTIWGKFDLVGIGGQFDFSDPRDEGYQILPRDYWDIELHEYNITIEELRKNDENVNSIYDGKTIRTTGIVNTNVNFRGGGLQISMQDNGWGITIFSFSSDYGYGDFKMGDEIELLGTLGKFNGLAEFTSVDTIIVKSRGNMVMPELVTSLGEREESKLIRIDSLWLVDSSDWRLSGSFNVDVTNGIDTFAMRIDSDTDIDGRDTIWTMFDLVGIGGQFDSSDPRDGGYQIFPTNWWDIYLYEYEATIAEIRTNDTNGVSVYDGRVVWTSGIVNTDVNFRGGGLQISMQDGDHGITLFGVSTDYGYSNFAMGDSIEVMATVREFNGLCELDYIDTIIVHATGKMVSPVVVDSLDEMEESKLVQFTNVWLVDSNDWAMSGSFNADFTNGVDTFALRVDSDTDIPGMDNPGDKKFHLTGIGGQYDSSLPRTDGYQLFPRSRADFDIFVGLNDIPVVSATVYPNPTNGIINIQTTEELEWITVYNLVGTEVLRTNNIGNTLDISSLNNGVYVVKGTAASGASFTVRVAKK